MEAVPRLHMLWFSLKSSPEGTSFANLKRYIAEFYQEDPESYSKEVFALETLRNQTMHPTKDGCSIMKRYYSQLHSLQNRFPQLSERALFTFTWKDLYQSGVSKITDLRYEMAAVLFNIAASHTQVGASVTRGDVDGMKMACTHFQCAAWAFGELRERYANLSAVGDFMTNELLVFMQQVSLAQAQECILEKSLIDNRKPNIVVKVTAQIGIYYGAALAALLTGGDDGPVAQVIDSSVYKLWKKYVRFKISYLNCILYLYQGQHSEEQQKMGERVTLYQAALEKLEEARKESKGLPDQKEINESLVFTADVVEAKRKNAKNENEFIYHEAVPELSSISAVQGANLVNGIPFSVTDPEVAGEDIFARLVPMKAHEASSMYSEEKAKILRKYGAAIEERDTELAAFMTSLTLDNLNINEEKANKIPQGIVDRCAALNANKNAIPDLIAAMSQLAETCADVEMNLKEIGAMLADEEREEREFQSLTGVQRTPNAHMTELSREFQKYNEAHTRAGESNDTLRKAMELHVNNLKILARPLQEIQQSVPKLSSELNTNEIFKDVKLIVNKVNEMKAQRSQFHADLRIAVNEDDITAKVIAHGTDEGLQSLFARELGKHERLTQLIDQNLFAQKNILQALTESYAKAAPVLKTLADVKHKRESFFSSLAASYDVYEDLLAKSAKGLEFYKKLSGNVQKLLTRFKSARDVQSEERQQRLKSVANKNFKNANANPVHLSKENNYNTGSAAISNTPKLRDYLKAKNTSAAIVAAAGFNTDSVTASNTALSSTPYIPTIRPSPLGSENPTQAVCSSGYYPATSTIATNTGAPNEPPPPYSLQQTQFYDPNAAGYTNPMFQQQQQNIAPPAYKLQASPNSQFCNLNTQMSHLTIQQQKMHSNMAKPAPQQVQHVQQQPQQLQQQQPQQLQQQQPQQLLQQQAQQLPHVQQPQQLQQYSATSNVQNYQQQQQNIYASNLSATQAQELNYASNVSSYLANAGIVQNAGVPQLNRNNFANYTQQPVSLTAQNPAASVTDQQSYLTNQDLYFPQPQNNQTQSQTAPIPTSQQLYVTTSTHDVPQVPPTLQAQFVGNPMQSQSIIGVNLNSEVRTEAAYSPYANTKHPGYSFNPQTGSYEYGSGYQLAATPNAQFFGQYTSAVGSKQEQSVGTTDSRISTKSNVATGFDKPIVSHTKSNAVAVPEPPNPAGSGNISYYTPPYGYHSNGASLQATPFATNNYEFNPLQQQQQQQQQHQQQQPTQPTNIVQQQQPQKPILYPQHDATYMQSGHASIAMTQTTKSAGEYASSAQLTPTPTTTIPVAPAVATAATKLSAKEPPSNIDLLTDNDLSKPGVDVPPPIQPTLCLQPQVKATVSAESNLNVTTRPTIEPTKPVENLTNIYIQTTSLQLSPVKNSPVSYDNVSICSDLSSLENNFNWDTVTSQQQSQKTANETNNQKNDSASTFILQPTDALADAKTIKYFHKEVERFEKTIESLNVKMLNGHTQLSAKWQELQELLTKEACKRTTTIAKLFPEKNRSLDCIPFDHARVRLDRDTDDYINAAFIKNLGPGCPNFIIAQTPQQNTTNDFWSMIWLQKTCTLLCLHTPNEMIDPFWPQELYTEKHIDDYEVRCVNVISLSYCTEYQLKLSMHGADETVNLTVLQIKAWTKCSHTQVIGIARNALQAHQQHCLDFNAPNAPLILNCLTGSERSEITTIAVCTISATQIKRPVLINVIDVWYRICTQRQNNLRDASILEHSMQIVLNHAHDVLNKRGILTSYQMKIAPQVASKEKEEIKDPLNELDPLWKLK